MICVPIRIRLRKISILRNKTHEIFWDVKIQPDQPTRTGTIDLVLINEMKWMFEQMYLAVSTDHSENKKEKQIDKYPDLAWELRKL